jgi:hypothetical protein
MRLGVRFGPVWVSSGGGSGRRKPRKQYTAARGYLIIWVIAAVVGIMSGGWWLPVLGWTIVGIGFIALLIRGMKHVPGAQHTGAESDSPPLNERMQHSDRR